MEDERRFSNNNASFKMRLNSENSQENSAYFYQDHVHLSRHLSRKSVQKVARQYLRYTLLIVIIMATLAWSGFSYTQERRDFHDLDKRIKAIEKKTKTTSMDDPEKKEDESLVLLKLCGDGQKRVKSTRGDAYIDWIEKIKFGNIEYNMMTGHINVKVSGTYYIYAQMYLFENDNSAPSILEFHVKQKNGKILTISAVPKSACTPYCTQSISTIVELKDGDFIFLTSYMIGVQFYMSCDKAQFGMYMLKKR